MAAAPSGWRCRRRGLVVMGPGICIPWGSAGVPGGINQGLKAPGGGARGPCEAEAPGSPKVWVWIRLRGEVLG